MLHHFFQVLDPFLQVGEVADDDLRAERCRNFHGGGAYERLVGFLNRFHEPALPGDLGAIGNGDVKCVADIVRMKAWTGCDAVMIGRAAVGNPWIFAHQERDGLVFTDITAVIRLHLDEMLAYYGDPEGLILFRPHLRRYFSGLALKRYLLPLLETEDMACFEELLRVVETAVPADQTIAELQQRTYFPKPQIA